MGGEPPGSEPRDPLQLSLAPADTSAASPRKSQGRDIYVWVVFGILLLAWPLTAILSAPSSLNDQAVYIMAARSTVYFNTGLMSWLMFFLVWSAQRAAGRPLREIGFASPRTSDPLIALGFLVGANVVL
ncbi:MAG: hypothetical protein HZB43_07325, partial [candidate division Zixibacteria bacterium]|nr:hypothetical protein [candidate division Zixibacteria bacterium]